MNNHINDLKNDIMKYADDCCFFDRMSLGIILTIFTCLYYDLQEKIFADMKRFYNEKTHDLRKVIDKKNMYI